MKFNKKIAFLVVFFLLLLTGCSEKPANEDTPEKVRDEETSLTEKDSKEKKVKVPYVIEMKCSDALKELDKAGFENISILNENDPNWNPTSWLVEKQSITGGLAVDPLEKIVLECQPAVQIPDLIDMNLEDATHYLDELGLINISYQVPDEWPMDRLIVSSQSIKSGEEVLPSKEMKLTIKKLCKLYVDLTSTYNLIFSKYDLEVVFDDSEIGTIPNGAVFTKLLDVQEGNHKLEIFKAGDHSIKVEKNFTIGTDLTFKAQINHGEKLDFINSETIEDISGSELKMINVTGMQLDSALAKLDELGFVNVKAESSEAILVNGNWTVVSQNCEPEKKYDKNDRIILSCKKTVQYINELFVGLSVREAEALKQDKGYQCRYLKMYEQNLDITKKLLSNEEEQSYWFVSKTSMADNEIKLSVYYDGNVEIPDVTNKVLTVAKKY